MAISGVFRHDVLSPNKFSGATFRIASRSDGESSSGGDSVKFSSDTLSKLSSLLGKSDNMTTSTAKATLGAGGEGTIVSFSNSSGAITWGGNTLNLKGFANALKDDLVVNQSDNGDLVVYNLSTSKKITLNWDGTQKTVDGKLDPASIVESTVTADSLSGGLFINNRGLARTSSSEDDILINRMADAELNAGLGNDKIFNFAASASSISGGGGDADAIFSVGLTDAADIDLSGSSGYLKLLGNMKGGTVNLGGGQNYVDAAGRTLTNVSISDSASAEASVVVANVITGNNQSSSVKLNAGLTALDVKQLTSSSVTFGKGENSLVADKITGTTTNQSQINSTGTNTYQVGSVSYAKFDSSGAISDAIKATGTVANADLKLSNGENLITATGTIKNSNINTGTGSSTFEAGTVSGLNLTMGGKNSNATQTMTVTGKTTNLTYTGSKGEDNLTLMGAVNSSNIDLGEGTNTLIAKKDDKGQSVTNTNITAGDGSTTLEMGKYIYSSKGNKIALGNGANEITMTSISGSGKLGLTIDLSAIPPAVEAEGENTEGENTEPATSPNNHSQTLTVNGSVKYLNYIGAAGNDTLELNGKLSNSNIDLGAGTNSLNVGNDEKVYSVSNTNITASGVSSSTLRMGNYAYSSAGNKISLGNGSNEIELGKISGKGKNGLILDLTEAQAGTQKVTVNSTANYLTYNGSNGTDELSFLKTVSNSKFNFGEGTSSLEAVNTNTGDFVYQKLSNVDITSKGTVNVDVGNFVYGSNGNKIELGNGVNKVNIYGNVSGKGTKGLTVDTSAVAAGNTQTLLIDGSASRINYTGGAGNDDVTFGGNVTYSDIDLGAGTNKLWANEDKKKVTNTTIKGSGDNTIEINHLASTGKYASSIKLGDGNDTVKLANTSGNNVSVDMGGSTAPEGLTAEELAAWKGDVFTGGTLKGTTTLTGSGKGTYTIGTGTNVKMDFVENANDLTLNIQSVLTNSLINLGDGAALISSDYDKDKEGAKSTANLSGTTINAGKGALTMDVNNVTNGKISRTGEGSLDFKAANVSGTTFDLTGDGSDSIDVTNTLKATLNFGKNGADTVKAGTLSGALNSEGDITVIAEKLSGLAGKMNGNNHIYTDLIENSKLTMGSGINKIELRKDAQVPTQPVDPEAEAEEAAERQLNITGSTIQSGSDFTLKANDVTNSTFNMVAEEDGSAKLDLTLTGNLKGSKVNLAGGESKITAAEVNNSSIKRTEDGKLIFKAGSVNDSVFELGGEGEDEITVDADMRAALTLGAGADKISVGGTISGNLTATDQVTVTAKNMENMEVNLAGATNRLDIAELIKDSVIKGEGDNTITAGGLDSAVIKLGAGNDHVDIYGDIISSGIQLGAGSNILRNTLTRPEEDDPPHEGQGTNLGNKVQDSTILADGELSAFLGDVTGESVIKAMADSKVNININTLGSEATVDTTDAQKAYLGIQTSNGKIGAGTGGEIEINELNSGFIVDTKGGNTITVGTLGAQGTIQTGDDVDNSIIHVNTLNGTVDLLKEGYVSSKLTIADAAYNGTVKIGGTTVSASTGATPENTSGFGTGKGRFVV